MAGGLVSGFHAVLTVSLVNAEQMGEGAWLPWGQLWAKLGCACMYRATYGAYKGLTDGASWAHVPSSTYTIAHVRMTRVGRRDGQRQGCAASRSATARVRWKLLSSWRLAPVPQSAPPDRTPSTASTLRPAPRETPDTQRLMSKNNL